MNLSGVERTWRGLGRDVQLMTLSLFIWGIGFALYAPILPVYLDSLGASPAQVGLVFSISYLVSMMSSIPGGLLADRFDRRRIMIFFWLLGTVSALMYALATRWEMTIPAAFMYFLSIMSVPAVNAYLADKVDAQQYSTAFAVVYATIPAAQLIGPGIGGYLADAFGMRTVFVISFVCYAISTLVLLPMAPQPPSHVGAGPRRPFLFLSDRRFLLFSVVTAVLYLYFAALLPFVSPYLREVRGLSLTAIGALHSIGAVGGTVLTLVLGRLGDRWHRMGILAVSVAVFALSLLLIARGTTLPLLALGFLLRGCFDVGRSVMSSIVATLTPKQSTGTYFGASGLATGLGLVAAPSLGGWLYGRSPEGSFSVIGTGGVVVAVTLLALGWRVLGGGAGEALSASAQRSDGGR